MSRTYCILAGVGVLILCSAILAVMLLVPGIGGSPDAEASDPSTVMDQMEAAAFGPWSEASAYRPGPFAPVPEDEDALAIARVIKNALELEDQAMASGSSAAVAGLKNRYQELYTNSWGSLDRHQAYVDANHEGNLEDGYAELKRETTRLEIKEIVVSGDKARAIVEQEHLVVRTPIEVPTVDAGNRRTLTVRSGRQLDILLEKSGDGWMIYADRFEFLPGMEPGAMVEES